MSAFAAAIASNGAAAVHACGLLASAPSPHPARLLSVADGMLHDWRGHSIGALGAQLLSTPIAARTALAETSPPTRGATGASRVPRHVAVVLIGRISNLRPLQKHMSASGWVGAGDDAAAVVGGLIEFYLRKGRAPLEATRAALQRLQGGFAFAATAASAESEVFVAVKDIEAYVGFGADGVFAISDKALRPAACELTPLQSGDVATLRHDRIIITDADGMGLEKHTRRSPPRAPELSLVAP